MEKDEELRYPTLSERMADPKNANATVNFSNDSNGLTSSDRPSQVISISDPDDLAMNKEIADEAARYFSDESDSDDSDNVTKSMKKQKSLLLSETYELNKNRRCCSSCKVVTNYLMIE